MTEATATSRPVSFLRHRVRGVPAGLALLLISLGSWVLAVDRLDLHIGSLAAGGWQAEGVRLEVSWADADEAGFTLSATRFIHPMLGSPLKQISLDCAKGLLTDREIRCDEGILNFTAAHGEQGSIPFQFRWQPLTDGYALSISTPKLANGRLSVILAHRLDAWRLTATAEGLVLAKLRDHLRQLGMEIPSFKVSGNLDSKLDIMGDLAGLSAAEWMVKFRSLAYSDARGLWLSDGLAGSWRGDLKRVTEGYRGRQSLMIDDGAVLTPFIYLDPASRKIATEMAFAVDKSLERLTVDEFRYEHQGLISLTAAGMLDLRGSPRFTRLKLQTSAVDVKGLYQHYFKPVLTAEFFQKLHPAGRMRLSMEIQDDTQLQIELQDMTLLQGEIIGDSVDNFRLEGLDGILRWHSGSARVNSTLSWRRAELLRHIAIGAASAEFQLADNRLRLIAPFALPVLDGYLQVEKLRLEQTDFGPDVDFQGYITPISMDLLSQALDWPPLAGKLSGMIPGVSYSKGLLKLRGVTLVQIFDGRVLLKNLVLEDLFGVFPVMQTDVEIADLDLKTLTSTFSFGKITGRIGGRIDSLRLENWEPVSFDAHLATPDGDPGPHRISQEAVDNISNLGGAGIPGAVSRGILSIFKDFGYDRLGISCRLERGVCEMGGIEPAKQGYYLVKGGGIPRIDIIGFNQRTDWGVLLTKLKQITEGGTPVIE